MQTDDLFLEEVSDICRAIEARREKFSRLAYRMHFKGLGYRNLRHFIYEQRNVFQFVTSINNEFKLQDYDHLQRVLKLNRTDFFFSLRFWRIIKRDMVFSTRSILDDVFSVVIEYYSSRAKTNTEKLLILKKIRDLFNSINIEYGKNSDKRLFSRGLQNSIYLRIHILAELIKSESQNSFKNQQSSNQVGVEKEFPFRNDDFNVYSHFLNYRISVSTKSHEKSNNKEVTISVNDKTAENSISNLCKECITTIKKNTESITGSATKTYSTKKRTEEISRKMQIFVIGKWARVVHLSERLVDLECIESAEPFINLFYNGDNAQFINDGKIVWLKDDYWLGYTLRGMAHSGVLRYGMTNKILTVAKDHFVDINGNSICNSTLSSRLSKLKNTYGEIFSGKVENVPEDVIPIFMALNKWCEEWKT